MKALLFATVCLLTLPLAAQNSPPSRIVPPRQGSAPAIDLQASGDENALNHNIQIRLQGTTTTGADIDLSLTGVGPKFAADQVINDDTVLSCQYVVRKTETGYKVSYIVSTQMKVSTGSGSFQYRDVPISGTVLCSLNQPVILVKNGQKPLQLTISTEVVKDRSEESAPEPKSK